MDINYHKDIKTQMKDCTIIGDLGCLSCNINLNTPMSNNQNNYKKHSPIYLANQEKELKLI